MSSLAEDLQLASALWGWRSAYCALLVKQGYRPDVVEQVRNHMLTRHIRACYCQGMN